ncbi:hypothetical protein GUITHDRAFT_105039 [Guillardia theta CCMP2712]|uniref:Uncharacterized protein n=1 Tax=Guillardia theta (strain CCMP2712) TaxID=905079 RepID=L1JKD8_GUITC|nr:hypothetical protein GUITHDRAFT_105039 [Guillardia theta CCMP2712]EKX48956.1 hypothetical protein GUITHDRAFT_105039 [Guillardia theta CCMP2712]|eukprot:XP_005835936.1 hypothetical protein GUITHDRAFT_105039 [Guillardia theta CCMP2712]
MNLITDIQNGFVGLTKEIESQSRQKFNEIVNSAHTLVPIFENSEQGSEDQGLKNGHPGKRSSFTFGNHNQLLIPEEIGSLYGSTNAKAKQEGTSKSTTLIRRHSISGSQVKVSSGSRSVSKPELKKTRSLQAHHESADTCDEATRSKIEQWFSKSRSAA